MARGRRSTSAASSIRPGSFASGNVARWSAAGWSARGTGMNNVVRALVSGQCRRSSTALYAGGSFTTAGGAAASKVARWDGAGWSALGSGPAFDVYALAGFNSLLMAGGSSCSVHEGLERLDLVDAAGGYPATVLGHRSSSSWNGGRGTASFVGGAFNSASALAPARDRALERQRLGPSASGISGTSVFDLLAADEPTGSALYLGGDFATFNSVASLTSPAGAAPSSAATPPARR